jgi:Leucine-rich repeat (LRR) protein
VPGTNQIAARYWRLRKLEALFLNNNKITSIPEEFYQLTQLKFLSLGKNQIRDSDKQLLKERLNNAHVKFE